MIDDADDPEHGHTTQLGLSDLPVPPFVGRRSSHSMLDVIRRQLHGQILEVAGENPYHDLVVMLVPDGGRLISPHTPTSRYSSNSAAGYHAAAASLAPNS